MANHNATVTYVEPNYISSGLTAAAGDGNQYERIPDLEDYCIAMNIGVEVSSREDGLRKQEAENRVLILSYRDNGNSSTVKFLSGTKLGGYKKDENGKLEPRIPGTYNAMTTGPMDMYVTDLVDYGTTEMIGVKSVNIDYNSGYIPKITIQFTDVRGMSLFQPKELNYDHSFNGIRGLSKGNIAQTFFQCFFDLPLPKFTIQIKGFYGKPVTYQMMCEKFDSNFNAATGDFDITASFIGYGFSFMSDIAFDALISAPYSDYFGEEYWKTQVKEGRFVIPDRNGVMRDMPRLYDVRENFDTLFTSANTDFQASQLDNEEKYHTEEISKLKELRSNIKDWYEKFHELLQTKYGKDFSYLYNNGEGYDILLLLSNRKDIPEGHLGDIFNQFSDDFREMTSNIYSSIAEYNKSSESFYQIKNIQNDFGMYQVQRIFRKLYVDVNTDKFVFDGFDPSCDLPRKKTLDVIFPTGSDQGKLKKLYHDGVDQFIYGYIIELNYSAISNRITALEKDANMSDDEKTRREKRRIFNQSMFDKMNWYPTIENFTKIVMAHLETLMAMMYNVVTRADGRTVADLGMSLDNCSDINTGEKPEKQFIPPFPRVTKLITDSDGITKREDAWIGEFGKPGGEIPEVDMINGLFNGISKIHEIEQAIQSQKDNNNRPPVDITDKACVVKYPTTPYDFYIRKNLYGDESDVSSNIYAFIGKVALRMFDVLAVNTFRWQHGDTWTTLAEKLGKIEAMNFHELVRLKNTDIFKAINVGGEFENADKAWDVINNNYPAMTADKCPWGSGSLFTHDGNTDIIWLDKYKSKNDEWIYPAQNFSFVGLEESKKQVDSGVYPNENLDIIVSDINNPRTFLTKYLKSSENNAFFNFIIEEDRKKFNDSLAVAASSSSDEAYSDVCKDYIASAAEYNAEAIKSIFTVDDGNSFSSFVGKFPDDYKQDGGLKEDAYQKYYHLTSETINTYANTEDNGEILNSISLSEVFGCKKVGGKFVNDTSLSYFHHGERDGESIPSNLLSTQQVESVFFLMGINGINYANVEKLFEKNSFVYVPKIVALQIGAVLSVLTYNNVTPKWTITGNIDSAKLDELRKAIPLPSNFNRICDTINKMNVLGKMYLIKYFLNWASKNYKNIETLREAKSKYADTGTGTTFNGRYVVVLRQNNKNVQDMTINLLSMIVIVRGNVNSFKNANGTTLTRNNCKVTKANAITFLNAFLDKLRQLNGLGDENGQITQQAKVAAKTTDDMKMELYRYLKQIYDKWIPATDFCDWKLGSFFGENECENKSDETGHTFHFIDSYYNRIDKKLLINPKMLSDSIATSLAYTDINVMMHSFLADVYAAHRCMLRCIQNFADLGNKDDMDRMFVPLPYNEMGSPRIHPDFVVIYTYEPSKNLNIDNGEFKDDSFMLNDEMETPVAIRTRPTNDPKSYYSIPAFGVSYGKQYQSFFKNVSVNMQSPIQTQQAIVAKHAILKSSRSEASTKTVTAQDLYDIYSTQSYTCNVEMMGCAWVQPMMYFVLLNIPMFRGSYMIMKVNHKITPGNMVTTFTGCRMANVGNRIVQDIFSDEDFNPSNGDYATTQRELLANVDNDCPYKVFPLVSCGDGPDLSSELNNPITRNDCGNDKSYNYVSGNKIIEFVAKIAENEAGTGAQVSELQQMLVLTTIYNRRLSDGNWKGVFTHGQYDLAKARGASGSDTTKELVRNIFTNSPTYILEKYTKTVCNRGEPGTTKKKLIKTGKGGKYFKTGDTLRASEITAEKLSTIICFVNYHELDGTYKPNEWVANQQAVLVHDSTDGGAYGHSFNSVDDSKSYWTADVKTTSPELTNDNICKLLFDSVQKSISSTNSSAALKYAFKDNKDIPSKPLVIKQQDGKSSHLAKVFDIILNTPEYYKHVQGLYWGYADGGGPQIDNPVAVVVDAVLTPDETKKQIYTVKMTGDASFDENSKTTKLVLSEGQKPSEVVTQNLLLPLAKKYADVKTNFNKLKKDCPQFTDVNLFNDTNVANCDSIMGNNGTAAPGSLSGFEGQVTNEKMKKVLSHVNVFCLRHKYKVESNWYDVKGATPSVYGRTEHGKCTYGPATWYAYADVANPATDKPTENSKHDLHFWGAPATGSYNEIKDKMAAYGFTLVWHGSYAQALEFEKNKSNFRPGDLSTQHYYKTDGGASSHAAMYTGKDWRSDFVQGHMLASYSYTGRGDAAYQVCVWRNAEFQEPGLPIS